MYSVAQAGKGYQWDCKDFWDLCANKRGSTCIIFVNIQSISQQLIM